MKEIATRRVQMAHAMRGWTEPHGYFEAAEAGFALLSGYPSADGNMVVLAEANEVAYTRLLGAVAQVGVPALMMFTEEAEAFGTRLPAPWVQVGDLPIMSRVLPDVSATMDPRVRVATAADEDAVHKLLMGAYGMTRDVAPLITSCLRVADDRQRLWLLEDGQPVSCVLTGRVEDTVSLWAMATPPQFSRQGYGRALLDSVLSWAGTDGARIGLLGATLAGLPLYERTGWTTVEHWRIWTNAASDQFPPH